jgi:hypothetical protein
MFEGNKEAEPPSETATKLTSWLTRLKPNREPIAPLKWPNPQVSVGRRCCEYGEMTFWEVEDPARTKLAPLEVEVQTLLNDHNEDLKDREASNLSFSLFMVGRQETTSCPTLVIITTNKKLRQRVLDTIRRSGILDKYEGVLLAGSSKHPRNPNSGPARYLTLDAGVVLSDILPPGTPVYVKSADVENGGRRGIAIYIAANDGVGGEMSPVFRKATIGGFFELKKENGQVTMVGMSVAHAFRSLDRIIEKSEEKAESEEDTFEFQFDGLTPDDIFSDYESRVSVPKARKFLFNLVPR